jgi:two-component sensor histidine kinase
MQVKGTLKHFTKFLFFFALIVPVIAEAQYYPVPPRIDPAKQNTLIHLAVHGSSLSSKAEAMLQLSCIYYYKPLKLKSDLDFALRQAENAEEIAGQLNDLIKKNKAQFYCAEILIEEKKIGDAILLLKGLDNDTRLKLLLNLSLFNDFNSAYLPGYASQATKFDNEALQLAKALHQTESINIAKLNMANIYMENNQYIQSENELNAIINSNPKTKDLLRYTYITYSQLYDYQGVINKSLQFAFKALQAIDAPKDSLEAGDVYTAIASTYYSLGDRDMSQYFCNKSVACYMQYSGEENIRLVIAFEDVLLIKQRKFLQAEKYLFNCYKKYPPENVFDEKSYLNAFGYLYKGEKKYNMAEPYYAKVLRVDEASGFKDEADYRNIGDLLVQEHRYAKAKPYLLKSLQVKGSVTSAYIKSLVHYYLFLCDSVGGNFYSAMKEIAIAGALNNKIKDEGRIAELNQLQVQYKTQEREKVIKLKDQNIQLLNQANKLQAADLKRTQLIKNEVIGGIIFLLILLTTVSAYYVQKQKTNKVITLQNARITQKNQQLEQLLSDKEWLLKEVHHRVKNNLHTVICLLESQAAYLENDALKAIETSQHRIYAMSLIHQTLYQSDDIKMIDMHQYLTDFVRYLVEGFGSPENIRITLDADKINLGAAQAVPLGLIINEAVNNSFKYAFPNSRKGKVEISLKKVADDIYLAVADDGIGFNHDAENELNSLGLELIKGLALDLRGELVLNSINGTNIVISFKADHVDMPLTESAY